MDTLSVIALNHVFAEQKQRRFNLVRDINYHENFLFNNLESELFWKIKDMAIKSFHHDFHLSKVWLADKSNGLLFERFQDSDTFCPRFCPGPAIKNISSKSLTIQQEEILAKGPKF
jgi:hypothetical protein